MGGVVEVVAENGVTSGDHLLLRQIPLPETKTTPQGIPFGAARVSHPPTDSTPRAWGRQPPTMPASLSAESPLGIKELFERHHDELYRYLVRLTSDRDLADDVAQETFIRWVEREPAASEPRAWLFRVATNLIRDYARVQSRRAELLGGNPGKVPAATPAMTPDQNIEGAERRLVIREILGSLPEKDRVILLMQLEGFSHKEIAEAINTTTGSVGTMLARALKRFSRAVPASFW